MSQNPILVALDYPRLEDAKPVLGQIAPHVAGVKIGLELMHAEGSPQCVQFLRDYGVGEIFCDAKLEDIGNTIAGASRAIARHRVTYFNVMASAGRKGIAEAVANKGESQVLVVTVLTSHNEESCQEVFGAGILDKVVQFSHFAAEEGADGVICSAQHLPILKQIPELAGLKYVTPGIRSPEVGIDDQNQVASPVAAMQNGAFRLVIGRELTNATDPVAAFERIITDLAMAGVGV